jgi:hypothetical protein
MEQRVLIKITLEDLINALESQRRSVEPYGQKALSYAPVADWGLRIPPSQIDVENNPRPGRPPDFGIRLCDEQTFAVFPHGSVRSIAEITGYSVSDAQKVGRIDRAKRLRAEILAARQNGKLFWTSDELWILWNMQRSGSWLAVDQKLPVRVQQIIGGQNLY